MGITYESICEKLGFDPINSGDYKLQVSDFEDDSKENPFSVLTLEESLFLNEYWSKHKAKKNS